MCSFTRHALARAVPMHTVRACPRAARPFFLRQRGSQVGERGSAPPRPRLPPRRRCRGGEVWRLHLSNLGSGLLRSGSCSSQTGVPPPNDPEIRSQTPGVLDGVTELHLCVQQLDQRAPPELSPGIFNERAVSGHLQRAHELLYR